MTIYSIADILTGLIEAIMMFMLCESFCKRRENLPYWVYIVGILMLTVMINISNNFFDFGMLNVVGMILSFFVMSFLYKGKVSIRAMIAILNYLLIIIVEIIVLFGITLIFKVTVSDVVGSEVYTLLGIVVSKMLSLFIINIMHIKFKEKSLYMGTSYWILFLLILSTSVMAVFLIFSLSFDIENTYMFNLSILCSFGLLFSTFFALYLYEKLAKQADIIQSQKQYEQHLKTQIKHLDEILVTQNQMKRFKHDFFNYKIGLESYLRNDDCDGAKKYLDSLMTNFKHGNVIIETGNTALDAILSTKKAIAESKGIEFETKIQIPQKISIDPIDMCIIFGNALDNAIEACERVNDAEKKINLAIICQDKKLFSKIENTAQKPANKLFKTSKADKKNHGYGLENIKTALAKYNSEPTISYEDGKFILKFVAFTKE